MRNTSSVWCTTSSYSKTSVFVRRQVSEKSRVFKNLHSEESFWKDAFSVTVFTGYVWTVGRTGEKNNNRVWATWTIFVFNRVGVWRPQRHTSTLNSLKCLPRRFQATKKTPKCVFLTFHLVNQFLRSFFPTISHSRTVAIIFQVVWKDYNSF